MASETAPFLSIPMSPGEEALKVFEATLRASVVNILTRSKLKWNTLNIAHRGRNPKRLDQCPPTIIITTDPTTLQQSAWKNVESTIRESIMQSTKLRIEVVILPGVPVAFTGINVHLPYALPRTIGYSFGPEEEEVKPSSENYSGTLGGYLILPEEANRKVILTCNHVANSRGLMLANEAPEKVMTHAMRSPSNQDHIETIRAAEGAFFDLDSPQLLDRENKRAFVELAREAWKNYLTTKTEKTVFPAGSLNTVGKSWGTFQDNAMKGNWVYAMNGIPTAAELQDPAIDPCTFKATLRDLRARFDGIWSAEMHDPSSVGYRQCKDADRQVGRTRYASGLRAWPSGATENVSVVDWALVEVSDDGVSHNAVNRVPEQLRTLANKIVPNCALAKAASITRVGASMQAEDFVFKVGRTTGVTAGQVDANKVVLSTEALINIKSLPADGTLEGHRIASAKEWNVCGLMDWDGKWVAVDQFARPGDSGAWVINANAELVGMVYCGMETQGETYVQDIHMILESISQVAHVRPTLPG